MHLKCHYPGVKCIDCFSGISRYGNPNSYMTRPQKGHNIHQNCIKTGTGHRLRLCPAPIFNIKTPETSALPFPQIHRFATIIAISLTAERPGPGVPNSNRYRKYDAKTSLQCIRSPHYSYSACQSASARPTLQINSAVHLLNLSDTLPGNTGIPAKPAARSSSVGIESVICP